MRRKHIRLLPRILPQLLLLRRMPALDPSLVAPERRNSVCLCVSLTLPTHHVTTAPPFSAVWESPTFS